MTRPGCTLIAGKSRELAKEYLDNWEKHKNHSGKYEGRYPVCYIDIMPF